MGFGNKVITLNSKHPANHNMKKIIITGLLLFAAIALADSTAVKRPANWAQPLKPPATGHQNSGELAVVSHRPG
jgi:hypothetical protein